MADQYTLDLLTNVKCDLDLVMEALSKAQKQKNDFFEVLEKVKKDGTYNRLVNELSHAFAEDLSSNQDLVKDYELRMDYGNTVEMDSFELDEHYIKTHVEDFMKGFVEALVFEMQGRVETN